MSRDQINEVNATVRELRLLVSRAEKLLRWIDGVEMEGVKATTVKCVDVLVSIVSKRFQIRETNIYARDRHENCARARQICMTIAKRRLDCSYSQIGRVFRRNHGTVMAAERVIQNFLDTDVRFREHYDAICAEFEQHILK